MPCLRLCVDFDGICVDAHGPFLQTYSMQPIGKSIEDLFHCDIWAIHLKILHGYKNQRSALPPIQHVLHTMIKMGKKSLHVDIQLEFAPDWVVVTMHSLVSLRLDTNNSRVLVHDAINALQPLVILADILPTGQMSQGTSDILRSSTNLAISLLRRQLQLESLQLGDYEYGWIKEAGFSRLLRVYVDAYTTPSLQLQLKCSKGYDFMGCSDLWESLLVNLTTNACKYCLQGTIRVSCEILRVSPLRGQVNLDISDTGPGLPLSCRLYLQQPHGKTESFQQPSSSDIQGTGVGMFIIRDILRIFKASIEFEEVKNEHRIRICFKALIKEKLVDLDIASSDDSSIEGQNAVQTWRSVNSIRDLDRDQSRDTDRDLDRDAGRDLDRDAGRDLDRDTDRDLDRDTDRDLDRDAGRDLDRDTGRDLDRDTGRDLDRDAGRDLDRDADRDLDRDADRDLKGDTGRDLDRDAGRDLDRDAGRDLDRDAGRDMDRDAGRDLDRDAGRDLDRDTGRDLDRDAGRDLDRDTGRDLDRDTGRDLDRDACRDLDRDAGRDLDRDAGRDLDRDTDRDLERDAGRDLDRDTKNDEDLSTITVMLVDDVGINRKVVEAALRVISSKTKVSFEVLHASNGLEAIGLYVTHKSSMLVFMDLNMPVMDGVTATKHIRSMCPYPRKVFICCMSAQKFNDVDGIFHFCLSKPVTTRHIKCLIKKFEMFQSM